MTNVLLSLSEVFREENKKITEELTKLGANVTSIITKKANLLDYIQEAEVLITGVEKIDKTVLDSAPNLKYISKFGTGVDSIDLDTASEKGVTVTNTPGQNASSVADLAIGLLLSISRNISKSNEIVKSGNWKLLMGNDVEGKRLGIIGFGEIGKKVAKRATGFDMDIVSFANYKDEETAKALGVTFIGLEELLQTSDYVVICTNLKKSTFHLLNKERLELMKQSAYLINISRGDLIDESALIECLQENGIKGAALDVFSQEPPNLELAQLENVLCSSHIGGATEECSDRIGNVILDNMKNYLANQPLKHVIV